MELGEDFHRLEHSYFDKLRFQATCDSAFADPFLPQTKMIKCHQFAYGLDWLKENVPHSNILLVRRDTDLAFDWWKDAGGWNISISELSSGTWMMHICDTTLTPKSD